eukprot:scaffold1859_cov113-Cylindrotheca_fusiformis.AAC.1
MRRVQASSGPQNTWEQPQPLGRGAEPVTPSPYLPAHAAEGYEPRRPSGMPPPYRASQAFDGSRYPQH